MRIAGSDIMMSASPVKRRIIPALRWCLIPVDVAEGSAGLITCAQGQIEMDWQETLGTGFHKRQRSFRCAG